MKKLTRILLLMAFIFSNLNAKADFVDPTLAEEVALNYLVITSKATSNVTLTLAHTEYVNNTPVHYVFDIDNTAHIIIAADDRVSPIRAYVPNGTYIVNTDNPDLKTPEVGKLGSGSNTAKVEIFIIEPFFCFCINGVIILEDLTTFKK